MPKIRIIATAALAVGLTLGSVIPFHDAAAHQYATVRSSSHSAELSARQIANRWAAAWNGSQPARLGQLFTSSGTYTDLGAAKSFTGRDEVAGWKAASDQLIADLHIRVTNAFSGGDYVAIETIYSGHFVGAPAAFSVHGTTILHMSGSLIASNSDNYNVAAVLAQSGLPADWAPAN